MMKTCRIATVASLSRRGMQACREGDYAGAEDMLTSALAGVLQKGPICYEAKIRNNLGVVSELKGDSETARVHYAQAHRILTAKLGPRPAVCRAVEKNLARVS